jgi:hypothetical protein
MLLLVAPASRAGPYQLARWKAGRKANAFARSAGFQPARTSWLTGKRPGKQKHLLVAPASSRPVPVGPPPPLAGSCQPWPTARSAGGRSGPSQLAYWKPARTSWLAGKRAGKHMLLLVAPASSRPVPVGLLEAGPSQLAYWKAGRKANAFACSAGVPRRPLVPLALPPRLPPRGNRSPALPAAQLGRAGKIAALHLCWRCQQGISAGPLLAARTRGPDYGCAAWSGPQISGATDPEPRWRSSRSSQPRNKGAALPMRATSSP